MYRRLFIVVGLALANTLQIAGAIATIDERSGVPERDPTRPPSGRVAGPAAPEPGVKLELSSVLIGATRRVAVIDGMLMVEGEERAGVKLWEIKKDRVVVSVAGRKPVTLLLDNARMRKDTP